MKPTRMVIAALLLTTLPQSIWAQTAADYVNQGRAFLSLSNLNSANNSFASALAVSPTHETANVFYAATRLLVLPSQPAGSNFRVSPPISTSVCGCISTNSGYCDVILPTAMHCRFSRCCSALIDF